METTPSILHRIGKECFTNGELVLAHRDARFTLSADERAVTCCIERVSPKMVWKGLVRGAMNFRMLRSLGKVFACYGWSFSLVAGDGEKGQKTVFCLARDEESAPGKSRFRLSLPRLCLLLFFGTK
ncbi:hypothetical protein MRY87_13640 [bacterium]|nr:hypothetical protein [bacterium]